MVIPRFGSFVFFVCGIPLVGLTAMISSRVRAFFALKVFRFRLIFSYVGVIVITGR